MFNLYPSKINENFNKDKDLDTLKIRKITDYKTKKTIIFRRYQEKIHLDILQQGKNKYSLYNKCLLFSKITLVIK